MHFPLPLAAEENSVVCSVAPFHGAAKVGGTAACVLAVDKAVRDGSHLSRSGGLATRGPNIVHPLQQPKQVRPACIDRRLSVHGSVVTCADRVSAAALVGAAAAGGSALAVEQASLAAAARKEALKRGVDCEALLQ